MCIQLFIEEQRDKSHQIISHHNCFVTVIILSKYILEPLTTFPEKGTNATVHPAKKGPAPGNYMGSKNGPSEGHGKGVNKKIFCCCFLPIASVKWSELTLQSDIYVLFFWTDTWQWQGTGFQASKYALCSQPLLHSRVSYSTVSFSSSLPLALVSISFLKAGQNLSTVQSFLLKSMARKVTQWINQGNVWKARTPWVECPDLQLMAKSLLPGSKI